MSTRRTKVAGIMTSLALAFFWMAVALSGQSTQPAQTHDEPGAKTAEQVFKNIQVLKGTPADQFIPAMGFMSAALGVDCDFCHAEQREKDDKKPKQTARQMIQMEMAINKESFEGRTRVTCNSCHQGRREPQAVPAIPEEEAKPAPPEPPAPKPGEGPTADQLLSQYVQALGGTEAIEKVASREEKGTVTLDRGRQFQVEILSKNPGKRFSVVHTPNGDRVTAFDGNTAWASNPGAPLSKLDPSNALAIRLEAQLDFASRLKQMFNQFRVGRPEKIKDQEAVQVFALQQGQPPVRLYFDKQSGLLVRLVRYAETPIGRLPTQIDYGDYRDSGGVKIPYRWTVSNPRGRYTVQIEHVQQNVPIDDGKFAMPMAAAADHKS